MLHQIREFQGEVVRQQPLFLLIAMLMLLLSSCGKENEIHKKNKAFSLLRKLTDICKLEKRYKEGFEQIPGKGVYANFDDLTKYFSWDGQTPNFREQDGYSLKIILENSSGPSQSVEDAYFIVAIPSSDSGYLPYGFIMDQTCRMWRFKKSPDINEINYFTNYTQTAEFIKSLPESSILTDHKEIYNIEY
jgi:hypothetical protein